MGVQEDSVRTASGGRPGCHHAPASQRDMPATACGRPWLLLFAAFAPLRVSGAYFLVEEGHERCFEESILEHQVLKVSYTMHDKDLLDKDHEKPSECKIIFKNPIAEVIKEHFLIAGDHKGALAHAAQAEGSHTVCILCTPQGWFDRREMRWTLAFDVLGEGSHGTPDVATVVSLSQFQSATAGVEELLERISAVKMENDHEKSLESKFVRTSEAVNTDLFAFKLVQILLLVGVTAFNIHHLSRFLKRSSVFDCLPTRSVQRALF